MNNPTYHEGSSGRWTWRAGAFLSDKAFGDEQEARQDFLLWQEIYQNSELVG